MLSNLLRYGPSTPEAFNLDGGITHLKKAQKYTGVPLWEEKQTSRHNGEYEAFTEVVMVIKINA